MSALFIITNNDVMKEIMNANVSDKAKIFVLFVVMFFTTSWAFAQNEPETAKPLTDMEVVRKVAYLDIEGQFYENVTISFKSVSPGNFIFKYRVKIKVVDKKGKLVYKKTFKNAFLYVFSDGQIQVGHKNFNQVLITKSISSDDNIGVIREKEGVY